jgi:CheY-like chemotaxis protein
LEVMLPDMDGLEVLRRLLADIERVPVLFLTARDDVTAAMIVGGSRSAGMFNWSPPEFGQLVHRPRGGSTCGRSPADCRYSAGRG